MCVVEARVSGRRELQTIPGWRLTQCERYYRPAARRQMKTDTISKHNLHLSIFRSNPQPVCDARQHVLCRSCEYLAGRSDLRSFARNSEERPN